MDIPILEGNEAHQKFREWVAHHRQPVILRGVDVGSCVDKWASPEYIKAKADDSPVKIHVTSDPLRMDFKAKNFKYATCGLHELIDKASGSGGAKADDEASSSGGEGTNQKSYYYLRSTTEDIRSKEPVLFHRDFPGLSGDFRLPPDLFFDPDRTFSSVFRVSSGGVRVWTHYDVMDNVYVQVVGRKRAVLWPPDQALNLYLDGGDKSRVIDLDDKAKIETEFPKFLEAEKHRWQGNLEPGDVLYIPALWFHNMTAVDFGVAVNVFWKNLGDEVYDKKDPYGNRDLLPAAKAMRMLDNVIKQLEDLPADYKDFYARQLIARIEKKCLANPI